MRSLRDLARGVPCRPGRGLRRVGLGVFVLALTACARPPIDQQQVVSRAVPATSRTHMHRAVAALTADHAPGVSAFASLADGNKALGARLRMIEQAGETLELQYFLAKPDLSAALVMRALLDAGDRGVRVRLLLDDVFTTTSDDLLAVLDAHPQIEVRLFNPAMRPGPKPAGLLTDFARVNRRMHNKAMTADGAIAIMGGRNIADEYFRLSTTSEFADYDLVAVGDVVASINAAFDLYWNDRWAVPISAFVEPPTAAELQSARAILAERLVPARRVYENAINDPFLARLRAGQEPVYRGRAELVVDPPGKLRDPPQRSDNRVLGEALLGRIAAAQNRVVVMTPYFVPEDYGARLFAGLAARGVQVDIVTNSLGSTNHAYVHAGYRRHRADLLRAGVNLYEIRADALQALGALPPDDRTDLVMHTKLAVIDGRTVFVGSLNFDPRSFKQNSEIGLFMENTAAAAALERAFDEGRPGVAYRLELGEDDTLQWHYDLPGALAVTGNEPGATAWSRFIVGVTALLGVEAQL